MKLPNSKKLQAYALIMKQLKDNTNPLYIPIPTISSENKSWAIFTTEEQAKKLQKLSKHKTTIKKIEIIL